MRGRSRPLRPQGSTIGPLRPRGPPGAQRPPWGSKASFFKAAGPPGSGNQTRLGGAGFAKVRILLLAAQRTRQVPSAVGILLRNWRVHFGSAAAHGDRELRFHTNKEADFHSAKSQTNSGDQGCRYLAPCVRMICHLNSEAHAPVTGAEWREGDACETVGPSHGCRESETQ